MIGSPGTASAPPAFERLAAYHDRDRFDCGEESLNAYLRRYARQNADRNLGVTHVAVESPGDTRILGYYTLLSRVVRRDVLPRPSKFPPDGAGVVLLGRLAVDLSAQGKRIGTAMLLRALRQTEAAAQNIGIHALVVNALNDRARAWYLGFEFQPLADDPHHLFLPVTAIRELGLLGDSDVSP